MRLTRNTIHKTKLKVRDYFNHHKKLGKNSLIYKIAIFICRSNKINIDYERKLLDNIEFFYDPIHCHWAETDGQKIYLNTEKTFTHNILYLTLIHEALHGMVTRHDNSELSEVLEHRMMYLIDKNLI